MTFSDPQDSRNRLLVLATGPHECPYFPERTARTAFVDPRARYDSRLYRRLMDENFRRSGNYLYRPACPTCSACQSLRLPVAEFRPRRRHRRCLKRNADVTVTVVPAEFREEHYRLYERYVSTRHAGGSMAHATPELYESFLLADWCDSSFVELRVGARLLAVSAVDVLGDALSAVYTFYDPDESHRSPGMLAILELMALARAEGRRWLYLGYWIAGCDRMTYKADYHPHEINVGGRWHRTDR